MKKEYHLTITRKDRIYLTLFVCFLLGWELIKPVLSVFLKNEFYKIQPTASVDLRIMETDSAATFIPQTDTRLNPGSIKNIRGDNPDLPSRPSDPMDIMTATADELKSIGFSGKTAHIIRKYIDAGGTIRDEKGLMKIYSMDSAQLLLTRPYILYAPSPEENKIITDDVNSEPVYIAMDLNKATAFDLESLPGIGPVLADRIIKFRTALGGFIKPEQLLECYGLTPETFEKIKPQLKVIATPTLISINELDPKTFSHPYLQKKMVWMIESYKKNHGPLRDTNDLRKVFPPDPKWCDRIIPYVKFDQRLD